MYVLAKLKPRAETTDTLLLFTSNSEVALEEILLSIFDNIYDKEMEWAIREEYHKTDDILKWCIKRMEVYQIVRVPFLEE